jgi:hypothetical protein
VGEEVEVVLTVTILLPDLEAAEVVPVVLQLNYIQQQKWVLMHFIL